jgi:hypothetical protein
MLPLTLPSPPLGERDSKKWLRRIASLSPIGGEGRVRGRFFAALLVATTMLWAAPAPADDPEVPEKYISVDEAKALVDKRQAVVFIDVREKPQYDDLHIKGAVNIPLDSLRGRLRDVPRKDPLVLY